MSALLVQPRGIAMCQCSSGMLVTVQILKHAPRHAKNGVLIVYHHHTKHPTRTFLHMAPLTQLQHLWAALVWVVQLFCLRILHTFLFYFVHTYFASKYLLDWHHCKTHYSGFVCYLVFNQQKQRFCFLSFVCNSSQDAYDCNDSINIHFHLYLYHSAFRARNNDLAHFMRHVTGSCPGYVLW